MLSAARRRVTAEEKARFSVTDLRIEWRMQRRILARQMLRANIVHGLIDHERGIGVRTFALTSKRCAHGGPPAGSSGNTRDGIPMPEKTWARTSMPKRTTDWRSCCLSSDSTGGIAMEKADLGCAPRKRLPRGLGSSSGAVGPKAGVRGGWYID